MADGNAMPIARQCEVKNRTQEKSWYQLRCVCVCELQLQLGLEQTVYEDGEEERVRLETAV